MSRCAHSTACGGHKGGQRHGGGSLTLHACQGDAHRFHTQGAETVLSTQFPDSWHPLRTSDRSLNR